MQNQRRPDRPCGKNQLHRQQPIYSSENPAQRHSHRKKTRWYKFPKRQRQIRSGSPAVRPGQLLRRFYINEGYADFQVKSAHAELSPAKDAFYITFVVEEGPQYKFGDISVVSELKGTEEKPGFFRPASSPRKKMMSMMPARWMKPWIALPRNLATAVMHSSISSPNSIATRTRKSRPLPISSSPARACMLNVSTSPATYARSTRWCAANSA